MGSASNGSQLNASTLLTPTRRRVPGHPLAGYTCQRASVCNVPPGATYTPCALGQERFVRLSGATIAVNQRATSHVPLPVPP